MVHKQIDKYASAMDPIASDDFWAHRVFPGFNDVGVTSHRWEISGFGDDLRYLRTQVWKLRKNTDSEFGWWFFSKQ